MAQSEAKTMEQLDRYWDAVVARIAIYSEPGEIGNASMLEDIDTLDRDVVVTVSALHRTAAAPDADAAFAAQLWRSLITPSDSVIESAMGCPATPTASAPMGHVSASAEDSVQSRGKPRLRRAWTRLVSLVATMLLIASGLAAYLELRGPASVSAQTILQRAAQALATQPGRVIHQIQTVSGSTTFALETWTQLDSGGRLVRAASFYDYGNHHKAWAMRTRQTFQYYDSAQNRVLITTRPPSPCDAAPFQQPWIDQYRQLLLSKQHLTPSAVSRQTLDGQAVYVLGSTSPKTLTPGINVVWYIDVRSYVPRGLDEIHVSAQGRVTRVLRERLVRYARLPIAAVPARVFRFHTPAGAHIEHVVNQPASCAATIPQLLSLHGQPVQVVVLAGHPHGLRLSLLQLDTNPCSDDLVQTVPGGIWFESSYVQLASPRRGMQLCLATSFARARSVNMAVPARVRRYIKAVTPPQSVRLRIAGQRATARYAAYTERDGRQVQVLWWRIGGHAAVLVGYQMERPTFLGLVDALVDGRTRPQVARSAQHDVAAST